MPRFPRNYLKTCYFHIIIQGINRKYIFNQPEDVKYYIKIMYKLQKEQNIKIIAYCIMNNHAHVLVETEQIQELSKYMQRLNVMYAIYFNKKYNRVGYVFRNRYKSEGIYSEEQLYNCIHYIYNNPVKAQICLKPEDYPYSNYKAINKTIEEKYVFIESDEDKEKLLKQFIEEFLTKNNMNFSNLRNNNEKLKELVTILKDEYKNSLREISNELKIGRETIRRIYNE